MAVKHVLARTPGPVAVNMSTTRAVDDISRAAGVPVYRTKIGEIHVVEEVIQKNAVIGGEGITGASSGPGSTPAATAFRRRALSWR